MTMTTASEREEATRPGQVSVGIDETHFVASDRLAALKRYDILDTDAEPGFDGIARLAAEICGAAVGLITFVDDRRQFFKAAVGHTGDRTSPLEVGFCPQVVRDGAAVIIGDTRVDPRYADNPATTSGVRFYAGVPLVTPDDHVLGTLCVLDTEPRSGDLQERERRSLEALASQVVSQLELRRSEAMARHEGARAEKHSRRVSLIAQAASLMLAAREPADTVRDLFELLRDQFGIDIGFHYRCGGGALGLVVASGLSPRQEDSAVRIEFGQTVCGIVAERREPMHVAGIQRSDDELFRPLKGLGLESYYSTPLLAGDDLLGTISFGRCSKDFSKGEIEALRTITSQLATVLGRQRTEAELRKSEVRLAEALATARLGSFEWDPVTGIVTLDDRSREIFGFPEGESVTDDQVFGRIHPDEIAAVQALAMDAVGRTARLEVAYRIVLPDGEIRVIDSFGDFILRTSSNSGAMVGVFADITERRVAEDALRESEVRYRSLFESVEQGFCVIDMIYDASGRPVDYMFVEVNPAFEAQTGLVGAAGRRISEFSPNHERRWFDLYGQVAETGVPLRVEDYAQGFGRWYEVYAYRVDRPNRRRVAALFNDVSERRRAEDQIRELNETLEQRVAQRTAERNQVWQGSRDILVTSNKDGIFRDVNPAWQRILGHAPAEVIGRSFTDFVWPDDLVATADAVETAGTGIDVNGFENRYRAKDGTPRWIAWRTAFESDLIYGYGRDVTEEKEHAAELASAQEALRQSQKMEAMGSLTGGVAHDFNNLLTPIVGSLDLLQRKGLGNEREQRLIAGAVQSAERARTLVQRLLAFARRQPLQATAFDLVTLVRGMADLVSSTTGPQIRVVADAAEDVLFAKVDPNQLEMAILNLAVNARDAMPDGGALRISVEPKEMGAVNSADLMPGRYLRLAVTDTGIGMDEATLKRATEPFFSTKGVGKGTGLGLSMAHGLASQLGGALTIQSTPGEGTSVELWLPRVNAPTPVSVSTAPSPNVETGSGVALLVDDEELVRQSTADMLTELGYTVAEAASAEEALRLIEDGLQADVLITDHLMPGMTGTQLARTLLAKRSNIKTLVVSGYAEEEGIEPDLPRLTKPFRRADLAQSLATLE